MTEVLKAGVLSDEIDLGALAHNAAEQAEEFVRKVGPVLELLFCLHLLTHTLACIEMFIRFGKPRGKSVTTNIYRNGCKTTISYIDTIDHHCHRSVHASSQCSECTPRRVSLLLILFVFNLMDLEMKKPQPELKLSNQILRHNII